MSSCSIGRNQLSSCFITRNQLISEKGDKGVWVGSSALGVRIVDGEM